MLKGRKSNNVQNVPFGLKKLLVVTIWLANVGKIFAISVGESKGIVIAIKKKSIKEEEDKENDFYLYIFMKISI